MNTPPLPLGNRANGSRPAKGAARRLCFHLPLLAAACSVLVGCETPCPQNGSRLGSYHPNNYYRAVDTLPVTMKRVAVLPITIEQGDWQADAGREAFEPLLRNELAKTKAFEAVFITPEQMRDWTGAPSMKADDNLPPKLFSLLREVTGCEGFLFAHIRPYHAYKPIAIGWQFKLIESRTPRVIWAADEVFDASNPSVAGAAERYWRQCADGAGTSGDAQAILSSPRRFSQYTLWSLLSTMPGR